MKKKVLIVVILIVLMLLAVVIYTFYGNSTYISNPCTQEYIVGESNIIGNVDVQKYINIDKNFEIGADKNGNAVFKNPSEAFEVFLEKYNIGIVAIKKEFNLNDLNSKNYKTYKTYAWQLTIGTEEEKQQAIFISEFLDIYENSFN